MRIITFPFIITIVILSSLIILSKTQLNPDTVCNFHIIDKIFSLIPIERTDPYQFQITSQQNTTVQWNFCQTFKPKQCINDSTIQDAFSFIIRKQIVPNFPNDQVQPKNQSISNNLKQIDENNQQQPLPEDNNIVNKNKQPPIPVENNLNQQINNQNAIAFQMKNSLNNVEDTTKYKYVCTPYSSNYQTSYFTKRYQKQNDQNYLQVNLTNGKPKSSSEYKETVFTIKCSPKQQTFISKNVGIIGQYHLFIIGQSKSGCPIFSISSIWTVLQQNSILFGLILFILGLNSLFFGRAMLIVTIFITGYFMTFVILAAICSLFLKATTSSIIIYFTLIFVLFLSTLVAYGCTKLINVSIFLVGAWLGFIIGALINSIFCSIFDIYSVWSLVAFDILCMIPLGLLTFKYADIIVILSTSITGSYMVVRPISWIFGGFPNEFVLQQLIQSGQLISLPWTFYIYLVLIIALAILGGLYQFLKLRRQNPNEQIEVNFVQAQVEQSVDKVKQVIDGFIQRFKSDNQSQQYKKMKQLDQKKNKKEQDQF